MDEIKVLPLPDSKMPIARAVVHNGLVYISGHVGFEPGTTTTISNNIRTQAIETFRQLSNVLEETGSSIDRLLMVRIYLADIRRDFAAMNEEYARWTGTHRPARTTVEAKLAVEGLLIEVDCISAVGST